MARSRRKLGEILKRWGVITELQIEEALKLARTSHKRIGETLIDLRYVTDADVAKALASQFDMEYIDPDQPDAIKKDQLLLLMPYDIIKKYTVLPLDKKDGRLKILIHDPMDLDTLDNLRFRMHCEIDTALGAKSKIKEYIDRVLSSTKQSIDQAVRQMTIDTASGNSMDASRDMSVDMAAEKKAREEETSSTRSSSKASCSAQAIFTSSPLAIA